MATPADPVINKAKGPHAPVINEAADRALGRIIVRYGLATFALLIVMTVVMSVVNALVPGSLHRFLDTVGLLVVMLPFFAGMNKLFAMRLQLGREFVQRKQWREAVAALDPFAGAGQRFLDKTGEAHYLLALAYQGTGDNIHAARARAFLARHRAGKWAQRLSSGATAMGQEKRPVPPKHKLRRRH